MSFKNTLESVTKDIQEIEKIVSKFQNYSSIPTIEIDLALHKLQNLYELLLMIREHEQEKSKNKKTESQISPTSLPITNEDEEKENDAFIVEEEVKQLQDKEPLEAPVRDKEREEKTEPDETEKTKSSINPETEKEFTIAEKLEKPGEFLNEKLAKGSSDRLSRLQGGPISSISGSIGINDRFYYIREVFEGNSENFKKSIEFLDKASNFNEAYNYLKAQLIVDMDSEATQNLLNLVRRKFISPGNE
jgi:hypothetical protein